jgi:hypothetical protein
MDDKKSKISPDVVGILNILCRLLSCDIFCWCKTTEVENISVPFDPLIGFDNSLLVLG